jgi:Ca2+-binding EF-hand superfamily protein
MSKDIFFYKFTDSKVIEFSEFCVLMQGKMKEVMCEAEVQQAYRVFDKDKNGSIPLSELRQETKM